MLFDRFQRELRHRYEVPAPDPGLDRPLDSHLEDTLAELAALTGQTADLQVNRLEIEGYRLAFVMFEGLVSNQTLILGTASDLHRDPVWAQDFAGAASGAALPGAVHGRG